MLIVGLGNPGDEYRDTRHNAGFMAVDRLASHFRVRWPSTLSHGALVAGFNFKGGRHLLAKPMTFMNCSGDAIGPLLVNEGLGPADVLVLVDDIALPVGRMRLRPSGSSGGHNGLASIEAALATGRWWRLRLGVGAVPGPGRMVEHVLGPFAPAEREVFARVIDEIPGLVCMVLAGFGERAMGKYNGLDLNPASEASSPRPTPARVNPE